MHPILAHGSRLALYLVLWVLVSGLLAQPISGRVGLTWLQAVLVALPMALVYAFVCLSAWFVARSLPIKTSGLARILLTGLVSSMVSSAVWLAIAGLWIAFLMSQGWLPPSSSSGYQSLIFVFGVLLYLLSLAVGYMLVMFEESRAADRQALHVEVLAREAELRSLRSQLDPHFLFNCLHSISALTTADPPAARRMCLLLGEFLRETLALGSESRITMGRELKLVDRLLAVERIRFGDRLDVDLARGRGRRGVPGAAAAPAAARGKCRDPRYRASPRAGNHPGRGLSHAGAAVDRRGESLRPGSTARHRHGRWRVERPCPPAGALRF